MDKKIAVYVGANRGYSLFQYLKDFDEIHVFEPDPEIFEELKYRCLSLEDNSRCDIILNNCACYLENGSHTLYVTENRVSTSLSDVDVSTFSTIGWHSGGKPAVKTFEVETVNLYDYLQENQIEEIDFLVTDAQGSDLVILNTIKPYLDNKKIKKLYCETHNNGKVLYVGLDNTFDKFKELLSDNYEIEYYSFDGEYRPNEYEIKDSDIEWDTIWKLK